MAGELIIRKRISELTVNKRVIELGLNVGYNASKGITASTQYFTFTDGSTLNDDLSTRYIRVGMRDGRVRVDQTLTEDGFDGIEDTDWENTNIL